MGPSRSDTLCVQRVQRHGAVRSERSGVELREEAPTARRAASARLYEPLREARSPRRASSPAPQTRVRCALGPLV